MMPFNFHLDENSWKAEAEIDMELFHQVLLYYLLLIIICCYILINKKRLNLSPKKNRIILSLFLGISRNIITFLQISSLVNLVEYQIGQGVMALNLKRVDLD